MQTIKVYECPSCVRQFSIFLDTLFVVYSSWRGNSTCNTV